MRLIRPSVLFAMLASFTIVACGGEGGSSQPDAKVFLDAPIDSPPPGLTGLGQKCVRSMQGADCPQNAPLCVGVTQDAAWCTPTCLTGGSGTTNAQRELPLNMITPPPNQAACTGAYTGAVGMPACVLILTTTPMHEQLMANTAYTQIALGCIVLCSANNMCPPGMAANTQFPSCICLPQ